MKKTLYIVVLLSGVIPQLACAAGEHEAEYRTRTMEQVQAMYNARLDPEGTEVLLQEMYQYNFHIENMERIRNTIRSAYTEHLPTEPLMEKVHEGLAKDIADSDIVKAVERVRNRYEHAYRHVEQQNFPEDEQQDFAELLAETYAAGLLQEDCERIMAELKIRTRNMGSEEAFQLSLATFMAARVMAHRKVDSSIITAVLSNAIQNTYQVQEMNALQQAFKNRVKFGFSELVAQQFSEEILHGVEAERLGERTMNRHGADFTDRGGESAVGQGRASGEGASTGEGASGGSNSAGEGSGSSDGAGSGSSSGNSDSGKGGAGDTGNPGNGSGHGGKAGGASKGSR